MPTGGRILLDATGRKMLDADGRVQLTRADGKRCKCCGGVDCYQEFGDCPFWLPTSYTLALSGITLGEWKKAIFGFPGAYQARRITDTSLPATLCGEFRDAVLEGPGPGLAREWPATWNNGLFTPTWDQTTKYPPATTETPFGTTGGLGLTLWFEATTPDVLYLTVTVGTSTTTTDNGVIFHGTVTVDPECDYRGQTFVFTNELVPADETYWTNPLNGLPYPILGSGGTITVTPCCPACGCPVPLATSYAATFNVPGGPYSGGFDLVGSPDAGTDDDGNVVPPDCYYSSSGSGGLAYNLVRQINPCGWTIRYLSAPNQRWSVIESDDPTGTYVAAGGDAITVS
jgi:hypothetical protein